MEEAPESSDSTSEEIFFGPSLETIYEEESPSKERKSPNLHEIEAKDSAIIDSLLLRLKGGEEMNLQSSIERKLAATMNEENAEIQLPEPMRSNAIETKLGQSNSCEQSCSAERSGAVSKRPRDGSFSGQSKRHRSISTPPISPLSDKYQNERSEGSNSSHGIEYVFHKLLRIRGKPLFIENFL